MVLAEIIALVFAILAVIGGFILLAKLSQTRQLGIWWVTPLTFLLGWWIDFETGSSNSIFGTIFNVILWAFVFSMIIVNIKVLISGSQNGLKRTKSMWTDLKSSARDVHNGAFKGWRKKKPVKPAEDAEEALEKTESEQEEEVEEDNEI